jgi:putative transposase
VLPEIRPVQIEVPRVRDGSFAPQIVRKRRRLDGIDQIVLSLSARGLTTGEIARTSPRYMAPGGRRYHLQDHRQGGRGDDQWRHRPLEGVYPVVFIDAIVVKVREGQVTQSADLLRHLGDVNGER